MRLEPYERNSWKVFSTGRRNITSEYIVDMEEGNGACSCENYDYVQRPIKGRCKHMEYVDKGIELGYITIQKDT